jgi:hypothetical protein
MATRFCQRRHPIAPRIGLSARGGRKARPRASSIILCLVFMVLLAVALAKALHRLVRGDLSVRGALSSRYSRWSL